MPQQMVALDSDKEKTNSNSSVVSNLRWIFLMQIKLYLES